MDYLDALPEELWLHIFTFLSTEDVILGVRQTCRQWDSLSHSARLWRVLDFSKRSTGVSGDTVSKMIEQAGPENVHVINLGNCWTVPPDWLTTGIEGTLSNLKELHIHVASGDGLWNTLTELCKKNILYNLEALYLYSLGFGLPQSVTGQPPYPVSSQTLRNIPKNLPNLKTLHMEYNLQLNNEDNLKTLIKFIDRAPNLMNFVFSPKDIQIENRDARMFVGLLSGRKWHTLDIEGFTFYDLDITDLRPSVSELIYIDLMHDNEITSHGLLAIASACPSLEKFSLYGIHKKNMLPAFRVLLQKCTQLRSLQLRHLDSYAVLYEIAKHRPELIYLYFAFDQASSDLFLASPDPGAEKAFFALANSLKFLQRLHAYYCDTLTDNCLIAISQGMPQLKEINLNFVQTCNELITDVGVSALVINLKYLEKLSLMRCLSISGNLTCEKFDTNQNINKHAYDLKELDLRACRELTDSGLANIANSCKHLTSFKFHGTNLVTQAGVEYFLENCAKSLKTMRIDKLSFEQSNLSPTILTTISCKLPALESLTVLGLEGVQIKQVKNVLQRCRKLTYFDVSLIGYDPHSREINNLFYSLRVYRKAGYRQHSLDTGSLRLTAWIAPFRGDFDLTQPLLI